MSSSRRQSKSEATSTPSSGNNSKRTSLSSKSSSSDTSRKEEIIDLGFTEDPTEAEKNAIKWIKNEMKEPNGTWVPLWGKKFTSGAEVGEGLANLGRVIGQDFIAETQAHSKEQKIDKASYRVDWEEKVKGKPEATPKGRHINAKVILKANERIVAYPFGILENDKLRDLQTNKTVGELSIVNKMLELTSTALDDNKLMTPEIAQNILKNFIISTAHVKEHFKESGFILRRLIDKSHEVILQSKEAETNAAYNFIPQELSNRVSDYLYEIWSPKAMQQLQSIFSGPPPEYEKNNTFKVLQSECAYAVSEDKFSGRVLNQFIELLRPYNDNHVLIFLNHLVKSVDPENELIMQKFQEKVFLLRRSTSPAPPLDSKTDQPAKSISSTASAMLSIMPSRSQATQALKETLQTPRTTEATMSLNSSPSTPKISSTTNQTTISNVSSDNKEDKKVSDSTHGMRK
jgi:hypothetical protein